MMPTTPILSDRPIDPEIRIRILDALEGNRGQTTEGNRGQTTEGNRGQTTVSIEMSEFSHQAQKTVVCPLFPAIRDEHDYAAHADYVHINPLKHGLVGCVRDWPHSSFHRSVARVMYPPDWAGDSVADLAGGERRT